MVKKESLPIYFDGKCDDPFWSGCKESAVYYCERIWKDRPDKAQYLCQDCYDALEEHDENFNLNDWEMIEE